MSTCLIEDTSGRVKIRSKFNRAGPDGFNPHRRIQTCYVGSIGPRLKARPYRAIVIDPLSTLIRDPNEADLFEKRWDETVVMLESSNLAVIGIVHPRKDNHAGSSLKASLKRTERLFSLPRIISYARAVATKPLLQQSKEDDDGLTHTNPIRDRFKTTGDGKLSEKSWLIGVLAPLKKNHVPPERLQGWQYSLAIKQVDGEDETKEYADAVAKCMTPTGRPH